jgi:transcriptional regulator with XRE-family HTH domain
MRHMHHLKAIRARLDLTQAAFAEAIGVTQSNVSHYECGRQQMPPDVARRLIATAKEMGVDLSFDDIYAPEAPAERATT